MITAAHLHLLLNHVPVLGTIFGVCLLLFGLWRKSEELKKTAMGIFCLAAVTAIPVYLSGEPAEEGVESLPGVSDLVVERHEEAAAAALTSILVVGAGALGGLIAFRRGRTTPTWFSSLILAVAVGASVLTGWVANLGGQIRHTEIRGGGDGPANVTEHHATGEKHSRER